MLLLPHTKGKRLFDPGAGLDPFKQRTTSEPQLVTSHPALIKLSWHTTKFILIFKFVNMKFHWELIMMHTSAVTTDSTQLSIKQEVPNLHGFECHDIREYLSFLMYIAYAL
jgi:hypothetical protein